MIRSRTSIVVITAGIVVAINLAILSYVILELRNQRQASCKGTLIALRAAEDTARAGIRPVDRRYPFTPSSGVHPVLRKEIENIVVENLVRREVIARVQIAYKDLKESNFCS